MIESFDELPPAWDKDFLPRMVRDAGFSGTTAEKYFHIHFKREYLDHFFHINDSGQFQCRPFGNTLEKLGLSDKYPMPSHKKERTKYLNAFRDFGFELKPVTGVSSVLLQKLWEKWEIYKQERTVQQSMSSPRQIFAELLVDLDLKLQKRLFEDIQGYCWEQNQLASAYVVEAPPALHHWVGCSLLQSVDGLLNATIISTTGSRLRDLEDFLQSVALTLSMEGHPTNDEVLDALCDRIRTQSIVIVVTEVNKITRELPTLRDKFWYRLMDKLERSGVTQPYSGIGGGLKLLMISAVGETLFSRHDWLMELNPNWSEPLPEGWFRTPIKLDTLVSIKSSDVRSWLARGTVQQFLEQQGGTVSQCAEKLCNSKRDKLASDPYSVLDDICCEFQFKYGLEALETIWKTLEVVA